MSDDARKKILARRASFVAAALAGVACQKEPADKPQPCLSVPIDYKPPDAGAAPEPCLSVPLDFKPPDAEAPPVPCLMPMRVDPPAVDAGAKRARADAGPAPEPRPMPCLTPVRPEEKK